jgi:hypothetical protein
MKGFVFVQGYALVQMHFQILVNWSIEMGIIVLPELIISRLSSAGVYVICKSMGISSDLCDMNI